MQRRNMPAQNTLPADASGELRSLINADAAELSKRLRAQQLRDFPPTAEKSIRRFSPAEASRLLGIHEGYLRQLVSEGKGPPALANGRRTYSIQDIETLRLELDATGKGSRRYIPHRKDGERLQVISVMNFKGGSGKTTTSAHLAQYLALRGYRVLAVDLDPQASLTALHGLQPEFDLGPDETLYGAIKYGEGRRRTAEVVRETYFPGLDLIPGNIEL